eukprot:GHVS01098496.1.p1 GENE.GHVS01098496.1~~GHVS01098496.1.p1  ORF type:complete len:608 (+),score=45.49 GHVS01098496.1:345-2168(+)
MGPSPGLVVLTAAGLLPFVALHVLSVKNKPELETLAESLRVNPDHELFPLFQERSVTFRLTDGIELSLSPNVVEPARLLRAPAFIFSKDGCEHRFIQLQTEKDRYELTFISDDQTHEWHFKEGHKHSEIYDRETSVNMAALLFRNNPDYEHFQSRLKVHFSRWSGMFYSDAEDAHERTLSSVKVILFNSDLYAYDERQRRWEAIRGDDISIYESSEMSPFAGGSLSLCSIEGRRRYRVDFDNNFSDQEKPNHEPDEWTFRRISDFLDIEGQTIAERLFKGEKGPCPARELFPKAYAQERGMFRNSTGTLTFKIDTDDKVSAKYVFGNGEAEGTLEKLHSAMPRILFRFARGFGVVFETDKANPLMLTVGCWPMDQVLNEEVGYALLGDDAKPFLPAFRDKFENGEARFIQGNKQVHLWLDGGQIYARLLRDDLLQAEGTLTEVRPEVGPFRFRVKNGLKDLNFGVYVQIVDKPKKVTTSGSQSTSQVLSIWWEDWADVLADAAAGVFGLKRSDLTAVESSADRYTTTFDGVSGVAVSITIVSKPEWVEAWLDCIGHPTLKFEVGHFKITETDGAPTVVYVEPQEVNNGLRAGSIQMIGKVPISVTAM